MALRLPTLRDPPRPRDGAAVPAGDSIPGRVAGTGVRRPSRPALRQVTRRVVVSVVVAMVLVTLLVLAAPMVALSLGYRTYVVAGDSMSPAVRVGDAVLLEMVAADDIRVGDLITFRPLRSDTITSHRVISTHVVAGRMHFRTKGDANDLPDGELVPASNVVGRVALRITDVGGLYTFATTRPGRVVLIVLPALILLAGEVRRLGKPRRRRLPPNVVPLPRAKRGRRRAATVSMAALVALAYAGPAAGLFNETASVGANTLTTGKVNPPTLASAVSGPVAVTCRVDLSWTAPATGLAPDGYDVYRSTTSGGPYSFIKHVGTVTSTSDTDPALGPLTTYYYVLQSSLQSWRSGNSNQLSVATVLCL